MATNKPQPPEIEAAFDLLELGRRAEAISAFEHALVLHPTRVRAWLALGRAHSKEGNSLAALEAYRRAVELRPHIELCSLALFHELLNVGRYEEARAEATRFVAAVEEGARCTEDTRRLYGAWKEDDGRLAAAWDLERKKNAP